MYMKRNTIIFLCAIAIGVLGYMYYSPKSVDVEQEETAISKPSSNMSFFVTSVNPGSGANLGGLAGADAYCAKLAGDAGVTGKTWRAYLSVVATSGQPAINAKDRIGSGPWYNYKGELVALSNDELHTDNKISKLTALTEKGEVVKGRGDDVNMHDILTGSSDKGVVVATTTDTTCKNWTSGDIGSAYVGHHDRIGINESAPMKSWNSSHLSRGCSMEKLKSSGGAGLFYCFAVK